MKIPMVWFITLASDDCGYNGTTKEFIVNWVYPLFLKARAETCKEDNTNWKQAMNGPFTN